MAQQKSAKGSSSGPCESCVNYVYDEEYECYCCDVNLDEDDMYRFLTGDCNNCAYYQLYDEYKVVRKQM